MLVKKSKLDEAVEFLRRELTHCVAEAGYVYAAATVAGISLRTLERASSKLNVQKVRSLSRRTSYWELPCHEVKHDV
jgi:hypothetical protein